MDMILKTTDLCKNFKGQMAVNNVSLNIQRNSVYGLLGPNGAGKSTLMKLLVAALLPTSGSILVDGQPLLKMERQLKAQLGYLPQDFGLFNELTVAQFLDYMAALKGLRDSGTAVREVIRTVNLEGQARARIRSLSGGQRQRVGIAMAMAFQPRLLLADEPTSALDVTTQAQIVRQMADLRREFQTAILLVTHHLGVASYLADRILVMRQGQVVEEGRRPDFFGDTASSYTRELLAASPDMEGERYV